MSGAVAYTRDRETARTVAGVRTNPGHWAALMVHAFRTWLSDSELLTWCGLDVDLKDGARQTTDTITCVTCAQASWQAFRSGHAQPPSHGTERGT